jgi:glycerol-3-phosphate dehydrogenase (NAD(P)+)
MKIGIIGSGSWGTALAQVLLDNDHDVLIVGKSQDEIEEINTKHTNARYFPNVVLHPKIKASLDYSELSGLKYILLAVPSIAIEAVINDLNELITESVVLINVAKGFHPVTHQRLSVFIQEKMTPTKLQAVVSLIGPSHAEEVVLRLPTTVNAVCDDELISQDVQTLFSNAYFRVYRSMDVIGSEIGVALKNIIAIGSGILAGLGYGDNARAALITRGLAEITRYGLAFGAKPETFLGLTGVGDLIVTCTSTHSRNFQAGYQIGTANSSETFMKNNQKTVEGVFAAKIVYEEAQRLNIEMPITTEIYRVLYENEVPQESLKRLMTRSLKAEMDGF